jgi:hypothetical protein
MTKPLVFLIATLLCLPTVAQSSDAEEVGRYVMTDKGLAKYVAATEKLRPLAKQLCDENRGDEEGAKSLSDFVARIDAAPGARAAIESAGMTTREYAVFTLSLFQTGLAAWALEQPGGQLPPGVQKGNVDFYKSHKASIDKIEPLENACDGDEDAESESEEP